jgi:hypothetical protein
MKTYAHLWHIAELVLEYEMFQAKVVEKIKTHTARSVTFSDSGDVYEIMC